MNATIGLLAYGLRPSPLSGGAPTWLLAAGTPSMASWELQMVAAHAGCHISAFCRNPLHPGPCKGWKHHLGLVSPGALHALEKVRHDQLESKRQAKVKALKEAGKAIPKSLQTPIVYDPAKNKHLQQSDKITPGLGIPTKGLTPEAAKKTLEAIPTKAQVGEKLDAKHAAEAAAAVPKPTQAPTFTTIAKAGLKDGDKVFLHGKGKTASGEPQLVTVRKYGSGSKTTGYSFEDANGNELTHPHEEGDTPKPLAGGVASKWLLSPAPGKSFPEASAPGASKATPAAHKTTSGQTADVLAAKHEAQATAVEKFLNQSAGGYTPNEKHHPLFVKTAADNAAAGKPMVDENKIDKGAKHIASNIWNMKTEIQDSVHLADLENALKKDIHEGVNEGKPTPVLDAAKEASVSLGQGKPGAVQALVDAVHAKIGISGKDDTPAPMTTINTPAGTFLGKPIIQMKGTKQIPGASLADQIKYDHVMKTIEGGNDNLPPEARAAVLSNLPIDIYDDHMDQNEKKAVLAQLVKAHDELNAIPNKSPDQQAAMDKAASKYADLTGQEMVKATPTPTSTPAVSTPSAVADHEAKLAAIDVGQSSLIDHIDSVDEIKPDEYQALNPKAQQKVKDILDHLEGLGASKPGLSKEAVQIKNELGIPHNHEPLGHAQADAFHKPAAFGSPNASAAPHVKTAIAYANGHQAATDTKKLAAYSKLSHDELAALDPNTQKLMAANLAGMQKKFLKSDKKNEAGNTLAALQVAQGGGAGAGGSSHVTTPAATAEKVKLGASAALTYNSLAGATDHKDVYSGALQSAHDNGNINQLAEALGGAMAKTALDVLPGMSPDLKSVVHPHLAAEMTSGLKGEMKPAPLVVGLLQAKGASDVTHFLNAMTSHPSIGPALGKKLNPKAGPLNPGQVAQELSAHAGGHKGSPAAEAGKYDDLLSVMGKEGAHASLGSYYGTTKVNSTLDSLNLGPAGQSKVKSELAPELAWMADEYKTALDEGSPMPGGLAGKIDGIAAHVNQVGNKLAKDNGWPEDGTATQSFKSALFVSEVKAALGANSGAGGGSTHTNPATIPPPSVPNVTPAVDLGAVSVPDISEPAEGEDHVLGGGDGIGHLSQGSKDKIGESFHSLPFGTSTSDPIESVFDNLVAVAGWHGKDAGPLSVLQAAQIVDEAKAKKYGSINKNLTEKALLGWLGTKPGKEYAAAYATPKADQVTYLKDPEAVKKAALESQNIKLAHGQKVQTLAGGPGAYDPGKSSGDFQSFGDDEAQKSQDDYMAKSGEKWTGAQKQAITTYTGSSYQEINDYLRGKGEDPSGKYQKYATQIQAGMRPLAHDQLLIRGSSYKIFPAGFNNIEGVKKLIGEDISDVGFVSTSIAGAGGEFTKAIKLHIEAPVGTMGAYVRSISSHPGENEMILAAGTKFRILSVDTSGYQPIVRLRVVS